MQALGALIEGIGRVLDALHDVAVDFERATAAAPDAAELAQFATTLVERLIGSVIVKCLEIEHPLLRRILSLLTVVELQTATVQVGSDQVEVVRRRLHVDRFSRLISDPLSVLQEGYGWGDSDFDGKQLMSNVRDLFDVLLPLAVTRDEDQDGPADLDFFGVLVRTATAATPPGLEASVFVSVPGPLDFTLAQLSDTLRCALQAQGTLSAGLAVRLLPPARLEVADGETAAGTVTLGLRSHSQDPSLPILVLGEPGGSRLQAVSISAGLVGDLVWDAVASKASADIGFETNFVQGQLIIDLSEADGFLRNVLPKDGIQAKLDFGLSWSAEHGFTFRGAVGLTATFPVGLSFAGLEIPTVRFALTADGSELRADLSAGVGLSIGSFAVLVDGVGLSALATFPSSGGNLGVFDLRFAFLPPGSIGLTVHGGDLAGGGFIHIDQASGRYSGMLQLQLRARSGSPRSGCSTPGCPGGQGGYALLLALRATFPAIQIGFGFALTGVGGLLALNRRVDVDALRGRLAAGTAGRILAPQDPVRNAPALLADLDAVFPVAPGITVVGPTVQLLWAGLVHLDVGVFIELPGPARVVLLGSAHAEIERDGRAYLSIRVDIVGVVDLRAETAAFDAVLIDSHLMGMLDLTGGAAFRLSWGAQPYAVLSLGGFNPAYDPEPLSFPATLTRIAMVHGTPSDELYLRFEGYFAITSNTLQFGASVEADDPVRPFHRARLGGFRCADPVQSRSISSSTSARR